MQENTMNLEKVPFEETYLGIVPNDVLFEIFKFVGVRHLASTAFTCRGLHNLFIHDIPEFPWKHHHPHIVMALSSMNLHITKFAFSILDDLDIFPSVLQCRYIGHESYNRCITCSHCGFENAEDYIVCRQCSHPSFPTLEMCESVPYRMGVYGLLGAIVVRDLVPKTKKCNHCGCVALSSHMLGTGYKCMRYCGQKYYCLRCINAGIAGRCPLCSSMTGSCCYYKCAYPGCDHLTCGSGDCWDNHGVNDVFTKKHVCKNHLEDMIQCSCGGRSLVDRFVSCDGCGQRTCRCGYRCACGKILCKNCSIGQYVYCPHHKRYHCRDCLNPCDACGDSHARCNVPLMVDGEERCLLCAGQCRGCKTSRLIDDLEPTARLLFKCKGTFAPQKCSICSNISCHTKQCTGRYAEVIPTGLMTVFAGCHHNYICEVCAETHNDTRCVYCKKVVCSACVARGRSCSVCSRCTGQKKGIVCQACLHQRHKKCCCCERSMCARCTHMKPCIECSPTEEQIKQDQQERYDFRPRRKKLRRPLKLSLVCKKCALQCHCGKTLCRKSAEKLMCIYCDTPHCMKGDCREVRPSMLCIDNHKAPHCHEYSAVCDQCDLTICPEEVRTCTRCSRNGCIRCISENQCNRRCRT